MDKIILKNNAEIEVLQMPSLSNITVSVADVTAIQTLKDQLTADNLEEVTIKNDAGNTTGIYASLVLQEPWTIKWTDDGILTTFGLREKTDIEKQMETINKEQSVQNGAIEDLGAAVSDIATGGEA